jgi:hypothetical protein
MFIGSNKKSETKIENVYPGRVRLPAPLIVADMQLQGSCGEGRNRLVAAY